MRINIQNVEDKVFLNKEIWRKMPDLVYLRDQWRLSRMTPMLRAMGRKSIIDFLSKAKLAHEEILSEYFNEPVTIDKIDRHLVKNIEFSIDEEVPQLETEDHYTAFSTYRKDNKLHVTFWR